VTLTWADRAIQNLYDLHSYIVADNPAAADATVNRITSSVAALRGFPGIGRPGRVEGTRELVISDTPYIAAYAILPSTIWVLAVLHSARNGRVLFKVDDLPTGSAASDSTQ
jgi:plasmid stabilization system protein ParE